MIEPVTNEMVYTSLENDDLRLFLKKAGLNSVPYLEMRFPWEVPVPFAKNGPPEWCIVVLIRVWEIINTLPSPSKPYLSLITSLMRNSSANTKTFQAARVAGGLRVASVSQSVVRR